MIMKFTAVKQPLACYCYMLLLQQLPPTVMIMKFTGVKHMPFELSRVSSSSFKSHPPPSYMAACRPLLRALCKLLVLVCNMHVRNS